MLVANLWDETGKGLLRNAHFSLYFDFLTSINEPIPAVPDPSATRFLAAQKALAFRDQAVATGVFCYANEYLCQFEFEPLAKAIKLLFPSADVRYFTQLSVDQRHTAELEQAMIGLLDPEDDGFAERLTNELDEILKIRAAFYDDLVSSVA